MLVLGVVLIAGVAVSKLRSTTVNAPATDDELVLDRVWIDHIPRHDKDVVQAFVALTEQPFGVFAAPSQWKGSYEVFRHETHAGELRIIYPQTNEREQVTSKARRCTEKGMDYCLELEGSSRGVKRYYSKQGWEIDGDLATARLKIEALAHPKH
ncbi:MAG: hypothetical protein WKG01_19955 [Kofleriaceae bacterium]